MTSFNKKMVFNIVSKTNFKSKADADRFVTKSGNVPVTLFTEYVIGKGVRDEKDNDGLIKRSDEVWVFGAVDIPMFTQIRLAKRLRKTVKFFEFTDGSIEEIPEGEIRYEEGVKEEFYGK